MTFREWAESHRLRVRRDEDNTLCVPGRMGQIYPYGRNRVGVMVFGETARRWGHRRRACEAVGMTVVQDGDTEGTLLFNPDNPAQLAAALKAARIKRRRIPTESQLAHLDAIRKRPNTPRSDASGR